MDYTLFQCGEIWHYRFQVNKVRTQKTTRESNRARADVVARKAYDAAVARANGSAKAPTLAKVAADWLTTHYPTVSAAHYWNVETLTRLHLYELKDVPISDLTTARIEEVRNKYLATHAPASANHWLRVIKLIVNWAIKREVIERLPWSVKMLKTQRRPRSILSIDMAPAWFAAIDDATNHVPAVATAIRMMFGLGLREAEATSARWEWFDWERGTYTPGITKGKEADPIPLSNWLCDYLQPLRQKEGLVAGRPDGSQLPTGFARSPIQSANAACGIKGITPHRLRGSFATLLSEAGVPVQNIQKMMRHKDLLTTMTYLEPNMATVVEAMNRISEKMQGVKRDDARHHP